MIETLFARASSSARLLEPPLGSYLESLAQTLQGQSYSREVIRSYVMPLIGSVNGSVSRACAIRRERRTDQPLHTYEINAEITEDRHEKESAGREAK